MPKRKLSPAEIRAFKIKNKINSLRRKKKPKSLFSKAKFSTRLQKAQKQAEKRGKQLDTRKYATMSEPERRAARILSENGIRFQREFEVLGKFFDFYVPPQDGLSATAKGILIEIDGVYWHARNPGKRDLRQKAQYIEDRYKNVCARAGGYKLIRIWEDEVSESHILSLLERAI